MLLRIGIYCLIAFLCGYVLAKLVEKKQDEPKPNEDLNSWREKHK